MNPNGISFNSHDDVLEPVLFHAPSGNVDVLFKDNRLIHGIIGSNENDSLNYDGPIINSNDVGSNPVGLNVSSSSNSLGQPDPTLIFIPTFLPRV